MTRFNRAALAFGVLLALGGCGIFKKATPHGALLGERVPILTSESGVEVEPSLAGVAVILPPATVNDAWSQPGGNAAKSMGNVAYGATPTRVWQARIAGATKEARLAAAPVIAGGKLYAMDTEGAVNAFDAATGAKLWSAKFGDAGKNASSLFGGGVSVDGDILYATNGLGDIAALKAADGSVVWKKRPGPPLRGSPALALGNVYAMSQDNQLFAIKAADGTVEWTEAAAVQLSGVFGVAAPSIAQGTVVAGFSSGDLNAYRYENGRTLWQEALSRTSINTSVGTLSDIDADPVIDQGRVFAIGQGGRMVSLELVTGQRLWEANIAGLSTPWVAGEWVFVVTDEGKLLCIARATGKVRWVAQLQRYRKDKSKNGPVTWNGPVLAGDRLILVSSEGKMVTVLPADGTVQGTVDIGAPVFLAPVVANSTLYILDNSGRISAFR
ncbi:MAG: PQQ-binding-like beta-propeller repeat protein [Sphingomonadaceae bacterium]|nr:PQQ-binding-like beta-propeller repeat protein [Sphingomonadaceae bacterium]